MSRQECWSELRFILQVIFRTQGGNLHLRSWPADYRWASREAPRSVSVFCFKCCSAYMSIPSPNLPLFLPFHSLVTIIFFFNLWTLFCFLNKLICTIFSRVHTEAISYFLFFSLMLHSARQSLGPRTLLQEALLCSASWRSDVLLCDVPRLPHPLMSVGVCVASVSRLL